MDAETYAHELRELALAIESTEGLCPAEALAAARRRLPQLMADATAWELARCAGWAALMAYAAAWDAEARRAE